MEEIDPKTVSFFEDLLRHGPIREVLIKQLNLLDSLTLIRLVKASPSLKDYVKNNANIWLPRIQKQTLSKEIGWTLAYYKKSKKFPGMYMTSLIFYIFPSFYDVFLFYISYAPHVWIHENALFKAQIETTREVITCQDWDIKFKDSQHKFNLDIFNSIYINSTYLWTKSNNIREKGIVANQDMIKNNYDNFIHLMMKRRFHELELVPRIGYWFKYFDDDVSFVLTHKLPKEPWPKCEVSLNVVVRFSNGKTAFFVFSNYNISKVSVPSVEVVNFKKNAILVKDMDSVDVQFLHIPGGKKLLSQDFNVTFFISLYAYRVYVFSVDMLPRFSGYYRQIDELRSRDDDIILVVEEVIPLKHYAPENQTEFLIESCVECQKPATLQCSGCHRAAYCGEECGKKSWEDGLHSHVCKMLN